MNDGYMKKMLNVNESLKKNDWKKKKEKLLQMISYIDFNSSFRFAKLKKKKNYLTYERNPIKNGLNVNRMKPIWLMNLKS